MSHPDFNTFEKLMRDAATPLLRNKVLIASKPRRLDCGCVVSPGGKYRQSIQVADGKSEAIKYHFGHCQKEA